MARWANNLPARAFVPLDASVASQRSSRCRRGYRCRDAAAWAADFRKDPCRASRPAAAAPGTRSASTCPLRNLRGVRGPRGGYELARDRKRVTANDILRAAGTVEDNELPDAGSDLLLKVVLPAMANAESAFGVALSRINVDDMARDARALNRPDRIAARP